MNRLIEPVLIQNLIDYIADQQVKFQGRIQDKFSSFSSITTAKEGDLAFIKSLDILTVSNFLKDCSASLVFCHIEIFNEINTNVNILGVENPQLQFCKVINAYFEEEEEAIIHNTAIISKKAVIGKNCSIGPYCVIGDVRLGDNCIINSHVHIFDQVEIGNNVKINSFCTIGEEGFGSMRDNDGKFHKFPQIAGVKIGNNVSISANVTIKKGAMEDTIVSDGTHIGSHTNIGHAVKLGGNLFVGPGVGIAGSTVVGNNCNIWSGVMIRDGITLGNNVNIAMGAIVTKSFGDNGNLIGIPAKEMG